MLRFVGAVSFLAAAALLVATGMFALDVLQMRGMRVEEIQSSVLAGGLLQEAKYVVASVGLCGYSFHPGVTQQTGLRVLDAISPGVTPETIPRASRLEKRVDVGIVLSKEAADSISDGRCQPPEQSGPGCGLGFCFVH